MTFSSDVTQCSSKETAAHIRTTFLSIVFVVWLWSVEQTNRITAKCEWRKLSREKACYGPPSPPKIQTLQTILQFLLFFSRRSKHFRNDEVKMHLDRCPSFEWKTQLYKRLRQWFRSTSNAWVYCNFKLCTKRNFTPKKKKHFLENVTGGLNATSIK